MSGTNTAIVRQVYDAFVRKDLPSILALQADDSEWSVAASSQLSPWAGPFQGQDGVTQFLRTLSEWLVAERFEILRYFAEGDTVVALGYQRGHVRPNHTDYEFDFVHIWTVRDSKVTRFRVYYDTAYVASALQGHPTA